jgi:sulfite exporter TauE/SafE
MVAEEQLKCNICGGITVSASQAKQHASTSSHQLNKSKLEQELNAVRMENYQNEGSVVTNWERSSV